MVALCFPPLRFTTLFFEYWRMSHGSPATQHHSDTHLRPFGAAWFFTSAHSIWVRVPGLLGLVCLDLPSPEPQQQIALNSRTPHSGQCTWTCLDWRSPEPQQQIALKSSNSSFGQLHETCLDLLSPEPHQQIALNCRISFTCLDLPRLA